MSQLGFLGSGNELQRQQVGPWSLGCGQAKVMHLGAEERKEKVQAFHQIIHTCHLYSDILSHQILP